MDVKTLKIGNMCCSRCITAVILALKQLGIRYKKVDLGYAVVYKNNDIKERELESTLKKAGFEIIKSKDENTSEKIKTAIHKLFSNIETRDLGSINFRDYLQVQVQFPYKTLSEIFSKLNKKTIENYFILYRIEKAKAMIHDSDNSFSEIAFKLGYNSPSYLSRQFKAIEGVSMREYKIRPVNKRKHFDKI